MPNLKLISSICLLCLVLGACGGNSNVKQTSKTSPNATKKFPTDIKSNTTSNSTTNNNAGGYYLDDGPGENPPQNIDNIPNAIPKIEPLLTRANKPYKALGQKYTPMKSYKAYKEQGIASWYGKRFHGKKTASGEIYDMYSMSAAHTTLPLPSYAKITNLANGRSVIVRINDRGPFKGNRIVDLSYAAAYQLRFTPQGSTTVEVEAIDPNQPFSLPAQQSEPIKPVTTAAVNATQIASNEQLLEYFVQVGAFKNESNIELLIKKIQGLSLAENVGINSVYNKGLYRLKLGPFASKSEADKSALSIRKQLNIPTLITNQ